MKKYLILLFTLSFVHSIIGQTNEKKNTVLEGRTGPLIITVFPLASDISLKNNKYPVIYPLLIVNNIIIRDEKQLNCFRNQIDRYKIKKINNISKEEAEKMGIQNVPKDGVLFITTKKKYYIDFFCE